jgi:hypothetical protein
MISALFDFCLQAIEEHLLGRDMVVAVSRVSLEKETVSVCAVL